MAKFYTDEKNALIIIALLKANGIRKVVASPGTTNMALIGSMQFDSYFQVYSSVDERSAAYIACGLAYESGEPVVISCTGATASRNYMPGLTEAYYRKLPVLAITSMQILSKVGHLVPQTLDRRVKPSDTNRFSVELPIVKDDDDWWECEVKVNEAILELKRAGGGPVHINLPTLYSRSYNIKNLPNCRLIERITQNDKMPSLRGKVAVLIGSHGRFSHDETEALDKFCETNDAVVFCDHTSSYHGKYRVLYSIVASQDGRNLVDDRPDVTIYIGEVTGDYSSAGLVGNEVWRVSEDGEVRDTFRKLKYIFEMKEIEFFKKYTSSVDIVKNKYLNFCKKNVNELNSKIPEIPFSNIWIALNCSSKIPFGSVVHFGILNSLRSWNFFELPEGVTSMCNVGGFGIDGCLSTLIGASLITPDKLYFSVIGDLAFFYDMNVLGNRHVGNNLRILIINNGKGTEFKQYNHPAGQMGLDGDKFVAAAGHFGNKSTLLIKNYAEALGFKYLTASNKNEFRSVVEEFTSEIVNEPIVLEVFTDSELESKALEMIRNIDQKKSINVKKQLGSFLSKEKKQFIKKIIK